MPSRSMMNFIERLVLAAPHLAQEVLLVGDLGEVHPHPSDAQLMLRGGICGSATKATPESPKSARHTAFLWPRPGSSPRKSAPIFRAVAVTMDSIMKPVWARPPAPGSAPPANGDDADPEDFGERLVPLLAVHRHETARIGEPFDVADRADPAERGQHPGKTTQFGTKPSNT